MPITMRVSDTERQRTVDELRRHCAAGRIDMEEYGRRIEKAISAEKLEELDAVLADLPILRIADPSAPGESRRRERGGRDNGHSRSRLFADIPGIGPAGARINADGALGSGTGRTAATLTALLVVAVVTAAVVLLVVVSWTWALVLIAGWVAGLLQAAASRRRRR